MEFGEKRGLHEAIEEIIDDTFSEFPELTKKDWKTLYNGLKDYYENDRMSGDENPFENEDEVGFNENAHRFGLSIRIGKGKLSLVGPYPNS
jgi:hypothetical protein